MAAVYCSHAWLLQPSYCNPVHCVSEDCLGLYVVPVLCLQAPRLSITFILYTNIVMLVTHEKDLDLDSMGRISYLHASLAMKVYVLCQKVSITP